MCYSVDDSLYWKLKCENILEMEINSFQRQGSASHRIKLTNSAIKELNSHHIQRWTTGGSSYIRLTNHKQPKLVKIEHLKTSEEAFQVTISYEVTQQ